MRTGDRLRVAQRDPPLTAGLDELLGPPAQVSQTTALIDDAPNGFRLLPEALALAFGASEMEETPE
jgi:hypothetical protein